MDFQISSLLISTITILIILAVWRKFIPLGIDSNSGVQKVHEGESFRIGGFSIIISTVIYGVYSREFNNLIWLVLFSMIPMILISVIEDLTLKISPIYRFIGIFSTSILLVILTGSYVVDVDIEWANYLLSFYLISTLFSVIGISTTSNAWNFIDGLNGLSSGLAIVILSILGVMAQEIELFEIYIFNTALVLSIIPFWVINLITGKVFLGDTGSYFFGAYIAWCGVYISMVNNIISSWTIFFIIIYPAIEITFSIFRRFYLKKPIFMPDREHLHSLFYIFISTKLNKPNNILINSVSGFIVLLFASFPALIIYLDFFNYYYVFLFIVIYVFIYFMLYIYFKKKHKLNNS